MMLRQVSQCPVCDAALRVSELSCPACQTRLHGDFPPPPLARLAREQQEFIETFVLCRGVIRDVERALGISYPTVRARLDSAVLALENAVEAERSERAPAPPPAPPARSSVSNNRAPGQADARRHDLLRRVAQGTLSASDAADALRQWKDRPDD